jgi:hypothetical protein
VAGRQRRELFYPSVEEDAGPNHDCTNTLLRQSCEGRFEIAIGSGARNDELPAQHDRRRPQFWDEGRGNRIGRVREKAERGSIGHQIAEQLQSFRRKFSP